MEAPGPAQRPRPDGVPTTVAGIGRSRSAGRAPAARRAARRRRRSRSPGGCSRPRRRTAAPDRADRAARPPIGIVHELGARAGRHGADACGEARRQRLGRRPAGGPRGRSPRRASRRRPAPCSRTSAAHPPPAGRRSISTGPSSRALGDDHAVGGLGRATAVVDPAAGVDDDAGVDVAVGRDDRAAPRRCRIGSARRARRSRPPGGRAARRCRGCRRAGRSRDGDGRARRCRRARARSSRRAASATSSRHVPYVAVQGRPAPTTTTSRPMRVGRRGERQAGRAVTDDRDVVDRLTRGRARPSAGTARRRRGCGASGRACGTRSPR